MKGDEHYDYIEAMTYLIIRLRNGNFYVRVIAPNYLLISFKPPKMPVRSDKISAKDTAFNPQLARRFIVDEIDKSLHAIHHERVPGEVFYDKPIRKSKEELIDSMEKIHSKPNYIHDPNHHRSKRHEKPKYTITETPLEIPNEHRRHRDHKKKRREKKKVKIEF